MLMRPALILALPNCDMDRRNSAHGQVQKR